MTLVKWNNKPSLFNDINNWFNMIADDFYNEQQISSENWVPNFNVIRNKDHYLVQGELAGLNKKDISIEIIDDKLKITGERSINKNGESNNMYSQINYGTFEKSYQLPENILEAKITAKMENGFLQINIPIAEPVLPESKKIKIN